MEISMLEKHHPDWASRAAKDDSKPLWQDKIPHLLWELGEVFFPMPPGKKGWDYPHHMQSKRFSADSETLNGYFEAGWGYGISCAGSTAVVDIDEKKYIPEFTSRLPETAYQWSGSREGVHLFYKVPGLENRQNMAIHLATRSHVMSEGGSVRDDQVDHVGEVKCDPHGYVIGPGFVHPSGNKYGPLKGDEIATVPKDEFLELIKPFIYDSSLHSWGTTSSDWEEFYDDDGNDTTPDYQFYELSADDILPWLEPNKRISHPIHGSDSGSNFMKNEDRETFTCWRCSYGLGEGCGLNAQQLLALMEVGNTYGEYACERIRRDWHSDSTLHYQAWNRAVREGHIVSNNIPYRVAKGYAVEHDVIDEETKLAGDTYYDIVQSLKYKVFSHQREDVLEQR